MFGKYVDKGNRFPKNILEDVKSLNCFFDSPLNGRHCHIVPQIHLLIILFFFSLGVSFHGIGICIIDFEKYG